MSQVASQAEKQRAEITTDIVVFISGLAREVLSSTSSILDSILNISRAIQA